MTGDRGEPLGVRRLLLRVLVVPGLVVALALGLVMATIDALQHRSHPASPTGTHLALSRTATVPRRTAPSTTAPIPRAPARVHVPPVGAYVGPGDVAAAAQLSAQLPHGLAGVFDYLDASSWATIADPSWLVGRWAPTHDALTLAVPMLPSSGGSLAVGATGAYDGEFRQLAELLVADGETGATLIVGWSPLEPGLAWSVTRPGEDRLYVAYFRRIVDTMRLVPGARFRFAFQPGPGAVRPGAIGPGHLYPGSAYVDDIATQIFNQLPPATGAGSRWSRVRSVPYGPAWVARLAARFHRRLIVNGLALVPAGSGGGGDDPSYVAAFFAWARHEHVASVTLWAQGSWAFSPGNDPRSFAVLRSIVASGATG